MSKLKTKTKKAKKPNESFEEQFGKHSISKLLLKAAIPAMIVMFVFGMYTFADNILAINLAEDEYRGMASQSLPLNASIDEIITGSKGLVRNFMGGLSVIPTFIFSLVMLFGVGVSARYSINIGAGKKERAIKTANTTNQLSLLISLLMIPILLFAAKPWVRSQFSDNPYMADLIADESYKYLWIIIISIPMQMFNQVMTSLFRSEARNKEAMLAAVLPIAFNLLFDWVFMGPAKMGIDGGAWATFISYAITAAMFVMFVLINKKPTNITFKNIFGRKGFKIITIIGVLLVGVAPFLRNFAQSIIQTSEMSAIQGVSMRVYGTNMQMSTILLAVFPIFGLVFPIVFGFIQAGSPIISFNYGAGNAKRVRKTVMLISLYSFLVGVFLYVVVVFGLSSVLLDWLGVNDEHLTIVTPKGSEYSYPIYGEIVNKYGPAKDVADRVISGHMVTIHKWDMMFHTVDKAKKVFSIMFISVLIFAPILGGFALFGSTDRLMLNIISSLMRSIILFYPFLYGFAALAKDHPGAMMENLIGTNGIFTNEFLFWWFYPLLAFTTGLVLTPAIAWTLFRIEKAHVTLEDRIQKINDLLTIKKNDRNKRANK